jgi:flavin-binding protein dodecin
MFLVPVALESVYRVTEVIGVSADSWEQAARNAVETVAGSVRELRIAEVVRQDVAIEEGKVAEFRVRLGVSFKYDKSRWGGVRGRRDGGSFVQVLGPAGRLSSRAGHRDPRDLSGQVAAVQVRAAGVDA